MAGDVPRRALPSELRTLGARSAQEHRCRAVGNRWMSPSSAMQHRGVAPDAANLSEHVDAIVGLGALVDLVSGGLDSRSKSQISEIRLSSRRRGASRSSSDSRPPLPNKSECAVAVPCLARIACTRFLIAERIRVGVAR